MSFFDTDMLPTDLKKDNYREYFEQTGIISKLTEICKKLNELPERPENPMEFIQEELGGRPYPVELVDKLEKDLDDAQREVRRLRAIYNSLKGPKAEPDTKFNLH